MTDHDAQPDIEHETAHDTQHDGEHDGEHEAARDSARVADQAVAEPDQDDDDDLSLPAWLRRTEGEQRWSVMIALLVAIAIQLSLPERLSIHPQWLMPALEMALIVALVAANPHRRMPASPAAKVRIMSLLLACAVSLANAWSAVMLVRDLIHGSQGITPVQLLMTGAGIWITNIIAYSLWYWEWDRGGPVLRAMGTHKHPDFLFPQMQQEGIARPDWEPQYVDYLYVAFTNATSFSPTDTMPLSRWAKLLMASQSLVSLLTLALVIARAVGVLQ
ncbi:DUF1345 domain-containing protein [Streptacidiphilus rugosus]|uniref:DUF1345 domain-containing protein n=1 Tax=Streptacidiphilus rugosus TaxID=405783 RepID=UPI001E3DB2F0|nr:DUF1345 domain-containing protein [Streptacidiphilus rugosus]